MSRMTSEVTSVKDTHDKQDSKKLQALPVSSTGRVDSTSFFLSLKWQVVLLVTLTLAIGFGFLAHQKYKHLLTLHQHQRGEIYAARQQTLFATLKDVELQLYRLVNHMQSQSLGVPPNDNSMVEGAARHSERLHGLSATLSRHWNDLEMEWNLSFAYLLDDKGKPIEHWGEILNIQSIPAEWLTSVVQQESPMSQVLCAKTCYQLLLAPIFKESGKTTEVIILATSLADAVLRFQQLTGAHLGLLFDEEDKAQVQSVAGASNTVRPNGVWGKQIIALTGQPVSRQLLQEVSYRFSLEDLEQERPVWRLKQDRFEISYFPLQRLDKSQKNTNFNLHVLFVDDVSQEWNYLDSILKRALVTALLSLIATGAILLLLLWSPMVRLQTIATILPKLSKSNRDELTSCLQSPLHNKIHNEIHQIYQSADVLRIRLDDLDEAIENRTRRLQDQSKLLMEEKDFVTSLLNTVRVVIITQTTSGKLVMINLEGQRLLEIDPKKVINSKKIDNNRLFYSQISLPKQRELSEGISKLLKGNQREFSHELEYFCPSGQRLQMEWSHRLLNKQKNNQDLILSVGIDLTARKKAENNLAWLADHDSLTGTYNRHRFHTAINSAIKSSSRSGEAFAILFFDIDQFQVFNDCFGHPAGDYLLKRMTQLLEGALRETDIFARLGGDEFGILLNGGNLVGIERVCKLIDDIFNQWDLHEECSSKAFFQDSRRWAPQKMSISLGAVLYPDHGESVEELLTNADIALFNAKNDNKAKFTWCLFDASDKNITHLHDHAYWKNQLEDAFSSERLQLFFQPILNIKNNTISHYEALIRMFDADGGIIPPNKFIHVAEKTGQIKELDKKVFTLACRAIKRFGKDKKNITLSVNLSARSVEDEDFIYFVESTIEEFDIDRSRFIFELTETSALRDVFKASKMINEFQSRGYQFALDDFGVGFASWYYLRELRVDFVKIDGSFVKNLSSNNEDRLFVKAIHDVSSGLNKKTIAEFVEDAESLDLLSSLGVNYAQGYFIGKPSPELLENDLFYWSSAIKGEAV